MDDDALVGNEEARAKGGHFTGFLRLLLRLHAAQEFFKAGRQILQVVRINAVIVLAGGLFDFDRHDGRADALDQVRKAHRAPAGGATGAATISLAAALCGARMDGAADRAANRTAPRWRR
ncbi:MAG: hypothetical protein WDN76_06790 [Alphaproteobacteria bacterium]